MRMRTAISSIVGAKTMSAATAIARSRARLPGALNDRAIDRGEPVIAKGSCDHSGGESFRESVRHCLYVSILELRVEWKRQFPVCKHLGSRQEHRRVPLSVIGQPVDGRVMHRCLHASIMHPAHHC